MQQSQNQTLPKLENVLDISGKCGESEASSPYHSTYASNMFTYEVANPATDEIFEYRLQQLLSTLQTADNFAACNENQQFVVANQGQIQCFTTYPVYTLNQLAGSDYFTVNSQMAAPNTYSTQLSTSESPEAVISEVSVPFEVSLLPTLFDSDPSL